MSPYKIFKPFLGLLLSFLFIGCSPDDDKSASPPQNEGYPPGIVLTFDDTFIDEWYTADALMHQHNWKATFFVTNYDTATETQKQELHQLHNNGHEIGGHGLHHLNALQYVGTYGLESYMNTEIMPMLQLMNQDGYTISSFAYPYGARSKQLDNELSNHFGILRSTTYDRVEPKYQSCFYTGNKVIYGLGIDNNYGNDINYLKSLMKFAKDHNKIVVFYGHKIVNEVTDKYQTPMSKLHEICSFAVNNGLIFYKASDLNNL
jgi:peptidoglycan/xylan/chitin deacetylase (PgdA/CDA1 family)